MEKRPDSKAERRMKQEIESHVKSKGEGLKRIEDSIRKITQEINRKDEAPQKKQKVDVPKLEKLLVATDKEVLSPSKVAQDLARWAEHLKTLDSKKFGGESLM
jgi:hypothetical protein